MSEIQTLARGLQIINALADAQDGLSITELGERFGVDKGNMSRFLQTLANYGFAEKAPDNRRYYLGPQVVRLSRSLLTRMKLRETAKPFLDELVKATGECAHLAILAQGQALYIDQAESPSALRVTTGGVIWITRGHGKMMDVPPVVMYKDMKTYTFSDMPAGWEYSFIYSTRHFINAYFRGEPPSLTGEQGREILRFALAAQESARVGAAVRL